LDLPGLGKRWFVCGLPLSALALPAPPSGLAPCNGPPGSLICKRSVVHHQLDERILKVMMQDEINYSASDLPNFLFLLKADR
jgi:hypothetical protein